MSKPNIVSLNADNKPQSLTQIYEKLATQYLFSYVRELKREPVKTCKNILSPSKNEVMGNPIKDAELAAQRARRAAEEAERERRRAEEAARRAKNSKS